jgi:hypothetical protein
MEVTELFLGKEGEKKGKASDEATRGWSSFM